MPVQLLRDALVSKYQDNQAMMAKEMGISPQRLQYLLTLDQEGKGDRLVKFMDLFMRVRKALGLNRATFYTRVESEIEKINKARK